MNREDLIRKWLDNELTSEEFQAFKQLEEYDELAALDNGLKQFKAESFNTDLELQRLTNSLKNTPKKTTNWLKPLLRVAAIITICFGSYYYTTTLDTSIETLTAQKETTTLPDASTITINALSSVTFNKHSWSDNRAISLEGEGYFKVAKGSKFKVNTPLGTITVLGTEFNVKQRANYFEVTCYEGSVNVEYNTNSVILKPGDNFLVIDGKLIDKMPVSRTTPSWINNESSFTSMPFKTIISEFERQYNVTFKVNTINEEQLFTGSFTHNDIDLALKAITLPLNLTYAKNEGTIILKSE
jgi:ferric-dicitrate binding protein FerR (iron transport regulator)